MYETLVIAFVTETIINLIDFNLLKTLATLNILKILKTLKKDNCDTTDVDVCAPACSCPSTCEGIMKSIIAKAIIIVSKYVNGSE